jgi:hypothetical protein
MSGMKPSPIKRKRGQRRKGKNDNDGAWRRLPETKSEKQVKIQFYIDTDIRDRMELVAPMLVKMEQNSPGGGIERSTPGLFCAYCCKTITISLEKMIESLIQQTKQEENNAITPNTHNNG